MESAKKALGLTKYFLSLPPTRHIAGAMLFTTIIIGAAMGCLLAKEFDLWACFAGAGTALVAISLPAAISGIILAILRRRVKLQRAIALSFLSNLVYLVFLIGAIISGGISGAGENLVFIGFGLVFFLWIVVLKFAFGLSRSCWIFAGAQMVLHALFLLAATSLFTGSIDDLLVKTILASFVFIGAMYAILFFASRPLKKNLGVSSGDALSMFAGQWLYGEKDLEDAFDEMGEYCETWIGTATFSTKYGKMQWIVPYFHFGPFGNLGGSQFPSKIEAALTKYDNGCTFVFHGTATHDLDPVSSSSLHHVVEKCKDSLRHTLLHPAHYSIRTGNSGNSYCTLLCVNNDTISSFSRAPYSTEDINLAVGWALMERARGEKGESLAIDCHNCETGDVNYVEPGSPIALEMLDALDDAKKEKKLMSPLLAGWASAYPKNINGIASGGIKVACFDSKTKKPSFYILIDSNGIANSAREGIIASLRALYPHTKLIEIFTSDTHELNAVKGVFNPAGEEDVAPLEELIISLAQEARKNLAPCEFGMQKERIKLKVLGPYQSAEIVSTVNAVVSLLKIAVPIVLAAAIIAIFWILSNV
ncbi:MAG: DUF2070 family protein [Candidatus Micrarchaeota archaeon]